MPGGGGGGREKGRHLWSLFKQNLEIETQTKVRLLQKILKSSNLHPVLTIIKAGSAANFGKRASTGSEDAEPAPNPALPMPVAVLLARLFAAYSR